MLETLSDTAKAVTDKIRQKPVTEVSWLEKRSLKKMKALRWRVATPEHDSQLLQQMKDIYTSYGISKEPRIIIYDKDHINAFYHPLTTTIHISQKALDHYSEKERGSILAHEAGHHMQRWKLLASQIATGLATLFTADWITRKFLLDEKNTEGIPPSKGWRRAFDEDAPINVAFMFGAAYLAVNYVMKFPKAAITRYFERDADRLARTVIDPHDQISQREVSNNHQKEQLRKHKEKLTSPMRPTDPDKQHIELSMPKKSKELTGWKKKRQELLRSHPTHNERVEAAREEIKKREAFRAV